MSRSSHRHHDWAHSFRGTALDDIHRFRFPHRGATAAPTRLVGVCYQQVLQPRTIGASECASLAKSKAHTKSKESTNGRDLCSKFSSGGDDLDQSIVGINDLDRFRHSHAAKIESSSQNHDAACESTLVMDSKGLFDALDNDLHQDDRKSALQVPIIEEFMRRAMCRPGWCPHNGNAADAMTKFKGAVIHVATHWNVHVEMRKIRVGSSCNSTTNWNSTTTQK